MKKLTTAAIIVATFLLFFTVPAFSQEEIHDSGKLHIYTLANGFQVFVEKDTTAALVHVSFSVKAGFSEQTPSTAGFFPLYSKLFLQTASQNSGLLSSIPVQSSCTANDASFSAEISSETLPQLLALFADCAIHPQFDDAHIKKEYSDMKNDVLSYQKSVTGFINTSIDSRIFSDAPWKHDSGVYPALFTNYKTTEVRTILTKIGSHYYTPDNSALFITGNISPDDVNTLAQTYFSSWTGFASYFKEGTSSDQKIEPNKVQKKFVLVDDSFSTDFSQIIVQYTSLSLSQSDILAASFTSSSSPLKSKLLSEPMLGIRGKEYVTAASSPLETNAVTERGSRLIVQALLEAPYSFSDKGVVQTASPVDQAELFTSLATSSTDLSRTDFIFAQNAIASKYKTQTGTAAGSMDLLSNYWALDTIFFSNKYSTDFYTRFLNTVYAIQNESEQSVSAAIQSDSPYIFLLVNSSVYKKHKKAFENAGYELVTQENGSWYANELVRKNALSSEKNTDQEQAQTDDNEIPRFQNAIRADSFYTANSSQFTTTELDNKIPLVIKHAPGSTTALISICIAGGESASPTNERFLRTILINAFANNIQREINSLRQQNGFMGDTKLQAWTSDSSSYITISCLSTDIQSALTSASNAILFGDISPVTADRLVYEQKNQWSLKSGELDYQMTCTALSTFFSGTKFEKIYDAQSSVLANTTFNSIQLAYTELLDASLYSLVITGAVDSNKVFSAAQGTFGLLKPQTERIQFLTYEPSVAKTVRTVRLRHTFLTDTAAKDAGERPEVLVPTTNFSDPVQFWILAPNEKNNCALFNAIVYELEDRIQKACGSAIVCSVKPATATIHAACIQGNAVAHTNAFLSAYKKSIQTLKKDFAADDGTLTKKVISEWIRLSLSDTDSNEGTAQLIQNGILEGNCMQYLEDYKNVSSADAATFAALLSTYFFDDPVYTIYSADSKK